jgi:hypothetical protein
VSEQPDRPPQPESHEPEDPESKREHAGDADALAQEIEADPAYNPEDEALREIKGG